MGRFNGSNRGRTRISIIQISLSFASVGRMLRLMRSGLAQVCRPKRSGKRRRGADWLAKSSPGGMSSHRESWLEILLMKARRGCFLICQLSLAMTMGMYIPRPLASSRRMVMGCMIWREMFGNGAWTLLSQTIMAEVRKTILLMIISQMLISASCAVARGSTTASSSCAAWSAAAMTHRTRASATVFVVVPAED